jgi:transposase-like protein
MSKPALRIVVSIDRQQLSLFQGRRLLGSWPVSSSGRGIGFEEGSYRTPTGRFVVRELIGGGQPSGTIFVARRPVGIWSPGQPADQDLILTRIVRLDGLDPENSNSWDRHIYIHGTNQEQLLGSPASMGCIRMSNRDIVGLFSLIEVGTPVEIISTNQPAMPVPRRKHPRPIPSPMLTISDAGQKIYVTNPLSSHYSTAAMATKKDGKRGKRYTPQEKEEILAFVAEVNSKNKRGGQKAAADKYSISALTISNWLKAAKSKGAAKKPDAVAAAPVAAPKVAKKKAAKRGRPAKKKAAKRGRPPKSAAAKEAPAKEAPAKKTGAKRGRPAKQTGAKRGRPAASGLTAKLNQADQPQR